MQKLEGLENVFQYASLQIELKFDKWKDVNITTWPREECIKSSLQTDGYTSFESNLLLPSPFGTSFSFRKSEPFRVASSTKAPTKRMKGKS